MDLVGGTRAETEALVGAAMRSTAYGLMINGADGWDANPATLTSVRCWSHPVWGSGVLNYPNSLQRQGGPDLRGETLVV